MMFGWLEVHAVDHCNNNCRGCHNFSPFCERTVHGARSYFPWLDRLTRPRQLFSTLSIMGGEPFLHPDLIDFVGRLRKRYQLRFLMTTNGFWLSEGDIRYFDPLWRMLSKIKFSLYPNMVGSIGGMERMEELLQYLRNRHPHLVVDCPDKFRFRRFYFTDEARPVQRYCGNAECTALLPDGRMLRCGPAHHHFAPDRVSEGFRQSRDLIYDLNEFSSDGFWLWRQRFPLDACSFCSLSRVEHTQWKVEPGTGKNRRRYEEEYHLSVVRGLLARGDLTGSMERSFEALRRIGESEQVYAHLSKLFAVANMAGKAAQFAEKAQRLGLQDDPPPEACAAPAHTAG